MRSISGQAILWTAILCAPSLFAQTPEGIWQGWDGAWKHVSQQLIALAEATPPEKFAWRPAAGVRAILRVLSMRPNLKWLYVR